MLRLGTPATRFGIPKHVLQMHTPRLGTRFGIPKHVFQVHTPRLGDSMTRFGIPKHVFEVSKPRIAQHFRKQKWDIFGSIII